MTSFYGSQSEVNTGPRTYETVMPGTSDRIRTPYPQAGVGEFRTGGDRDRIYAYAPAALGTGAVGVTLTQSVSTLNPDGSRSVTSPTSCVVAAGAGWNSDAAFLAGEYGWLWRAKPNI